ncbi:phosphoenolpyruvate synthase [Patescibacteria group bacterium]|nr:phosphoenolpyruvate synthase [Patescibacteria group bacterium]
MQKKEKNILWLSEVVNKDVLLVGGKNASMGEMYQKLTKKGITIPNAFAVTARAYRTFIEHAGIKEKMEEALQGLDTHDMDNLSTRGRAVRNLILESDFPKKLEVEIIKAYDVLSKEYKKRSVDVAVRSSATAEDLPDASFAGQQETYLNITGQYQLLQSVKKCMASLFTNRAISYRVDKGFDHFSVELSVLIQKMVRSDVGASGVLFTIDTESGFENAIVINAGYGLGENIVKGVINPDTYYVFKPTLCDGYRAKARKNKFDYRPILSKSIGTKELRMVYSPEGTSPTKNEKVPKDEQEKCSLTDDEILQLSYWACLIEKHYKRPMDIEWAKDGKEDALYIVQARPETVHTQTEEGMLTEYSLSKKGSVLVSGESIGSKIGQGRVRVIEDVSKIHTFKEGEVLVTEITDPDWEPIMKIAAAIVTNSGGRTSHAAIVSRELGTPCIVGTGNATSILKNGQEITVSCAEGMEGMVFAGMLPYKETKIDLKKIPKTKTDIMMNVGTPDKAFDFAMLPHDGVGLARIEHILINSVKVHPNALIYYSGIQEESVKNEIDEITKGFKNKEEFFVEKLAEGVAMIAAAFYPEDVIVRLTDLKTNEYSTMVGGKDFEPHEENPMLGWRGASRYYSDEYKKAFELECKAIKKVRDGMGLYNLKVMVPFCRTPEEGKKVIDLLAQNGLKRKRVGTRKGAKDLDIYVMCEIPSNVVLAKEFAKIFDGFSIGSNDLTQLTLGLDRDSSLVSHLFDERNEAVKSLIAEVIKTAHACKRKIGICGQGPSDFPDFAAFLVEAGIDSMSLTPDTVIKTRIAVAKKEGELRKK